MEYKHLFFDLDRTLWDMETNSMETLIVLFENYQLKERGIHSFSEFLERYKEINFQLWDDYSRDIVDKETLRFERFHRAFALYGIQDNELTKAFGNDYVNYSPMRNKLMPDTKEVLEYLNGKYTMHIITNGFEEVQHIKMKNSGIDHYFSEVITSERAGFKKPDSRIFQYSLNVAKAVSGNCLMIGD